MNILAFDTSLASCSAAILKQGALAAHIFESRGRGQAERLVPMIEEVCHQAAIGFNDVDLLVVGRGPGTFTGVRIGLSAAKGMALALDVPLMGINSLEAVAWAVDYEDDMPFMVAHDARRGEVYTQSFIYENRHLKPLTEAMAVPLDRVKDFMLPQLGAVFGTGSGLIRDNLDEPGALFFSSENHMPDAAILAKMAAHRYGGEAGGYDRSSVSPLYLRAPDAIPPKAIILPFQENGQNP